MNIPYQDKPRKVIPRWRDYLASAQRGELAATGQRERPSLVREDTIARRQQEWEKNRSLSFAADLVGTALVMDRLSRARQAAEFILTNTTPQDDNGLRELAYRALEGSQTTPRRTPHQYGLFYATPDELVGRIRGLRLRLREEPRNAVAWIDLALAYTDLGQLDPATKAIEVALKLGSDNRFVLRSASRFFVHKHEHDRALQYLRRSPSAPHDPWLAAAEIATADSIGRTPRLVKDGRRLVASSTLSRFAVSELASALGTLELASGSAKEGRRLLRTSLLDPTDNSYAQAEWCAREYKVVAVDAAAHHRVESHEASAWIAFRSGDWNSAFSSSISWLHDEPFSASPAVLGSYIGSIGMGDYEEALRIVQTGLIANPDHWLLLNNKAFALVNLHRLDEATRTLAQVRRQSMSDHDRAVIRATEGAILFRRGEINGGRAAYLEAVRFLGGRREQKTRSIALLCWAREETLAAQPDRVVIAARAIEEARTLEEGNPDIRALIDDVETLLRVATVHLHR